MDPPDPGDAELRACVAGAREGDLEARNQLFAHYRPQLESYVQKQLGPRTRRWVDPDDVVDPDHVAQLEGTGTVSGTLLMALDVRDFQEHRYEVQMSRSLKTFEGPFDRRAGEKGTVRAEVLQTDHIETVIRRER